ncbi:unnamed protein product, partial [Rotaria sp. Silwood1]
TEEATIDQDITKEYARQRDHLERTVRSLKSKVDKDSDRHKMENIRIMQENVTLIKEINDLRRELKSARVKLQDLQTAMGISRKTAARTTEEIVQALNTHQNNHLVKEKQSELENLIQRQRTEIQRLNEQTAHVQCSEEVIEYYVRQERARLDLKWCLDQFFGWNVSHPCLGQLATANIFGTVHMAYIIGFELANVVIAPANMSGNSVVIRRDDIYSAEDSPFCETFLLN